MKRYQNLLMIIAVVLLMVFPLWMIKKPAPGLNGKEVEIFQGSDDQAKDIIGTIVPGYKPWVRPLMEPPSGEVESLLFALQASLGSGFIGYYLGISVTRAKMQREFGKKTQC